MIMIALLLYLAIDRSICMMNHRFFVTNWLQHKMCIYNDSGSEIHSVDVKGEPLGMCTDKDGFIYISNVADHSILVY